MNRTYQRNPNARTALSRGRPLGFLIAWLRCCGKFGDGPANRKNHHAAANAQPPYEFLASGLSVERRSAREWALANLPLNLEADKRPGEGDEPEGRP